MFDLVQFFVTLVRQLTALSDLEAALDAVTRDLGFDYFALIEHVDLKKRLSGEILALSTYPTHWVDLYLAEQMVTFDPILLASHRTNNGFLWDNAGAHITITAAHRRLRERTVKAGIVDGFTVPAQIPGRCHGSCNFALAKPRVLAAEAYLAAQLIGSFAFEAGWLLVQQNRTSVQPAKITPRMLDCVMLIAQGKSDWETATILGIKEDTVTEYIDEARHRYGVVARTQLLMHILFDGHFALSDVVHRLSPLKGGSTGTAFAVICLQLSGGDYDQPDQPLQPRSSSAAARCDACRPEARVRRSAQVGCPS